MARTNGHATANLTSWGHAANWEREQVGGQRADPEGLFGSLGSCACPATGRAYADRDRMAARSS